MKVILRVSYLAQCFAVLKNALARIPFLQDNNKGLTGKSRATNLFYEKLLWYNIFGWNHFWLPQTIVIKIKSRKKNHYKEEDQEYKVHYNNITCYNQMKFNLKFSLNFNWHLKKQNHLFGIQSKGKHSLCNMNNQWFGIITTISNEQTKIFYHWSCLEMPLRFEKV